MASKRPIEITMTFDNGHATGRIQVAVSGDARRDRIKALASALYDQIDIARTLGVEPVPEREVDF